MVQTHSFLAGILNTFNKLIPPHIGDGSFFRELAKDLKPSCGSICVFVGFNASNEELGLRAQNTWAYVNNDGAGYLIDGYMNTEGKEAVMSKEPPLLFLSFPSTKAYLKCYIISYLILIFAALIGLKIMDQ